MRRSTKPGTKAEALDSSNPTTMSTAPVATNIDFGNNSSYINVPAETYAIAVVSAGTTPIPATVTLHTGAQVSYVSGSAHTVVLIDQPVATTPGVQTVVTDDYEQ